MWRPRGGGTGLPFEAGGQMAGHGPGRKGRISCNRIPEWKLTPHLGTILTHIHIEIKGKKNWVKSDIITGILIILVPSETRASRGSAGLRAARRPAGSHVYAPSVCVSQQFHTDGGRQPHLKYSTFFLNVPSLLASNGAWMFSETQGAPAESL